MSKRIRFFTLFLWLTVTAFPAFAQDHADTLHVCPCSANIAAFDLPWLAKYYGLDWKTDSLTAAQSAADSLAKAEAEHPLPAGQPAALGHAHARPWHRMAHQSVRGHHGERFVDLVDME